MKSSVVRNASISISNTSITPYHSIFRYGEGAITVTEVRSGNMSPTLHNSCTFKRLFVRGAQEACIANVRSIPRTFSTRNIWITSEFDRFNAASVDPCLSLASQELFLAFMLTLHD